METKITRISPTSDQGLSQTSAPLFSSQPAAGFPNVGDDSVEESLDLNTLLVDNPTATFFVTVAGDSMEGAKIFDGDILVVNRSRTPKSGSLVVAAVNGELVVKRLKQTTTGMCLVSENDAYEPIILSETDDCFVWGVVTGSARKLS